MHKPTSGLRCRLVRRLVGPKERCVRWSTYLSHLLIHPLDSLKVKMQTFPHLYDSGLQCARQVTRQDGLRGLYRGLTPGVTLSMTEASIRYMTYGVCQVGSVNVNQCQCGI